MLNVFETMVYVHKKQFLLYYLHYCTCTYKCFKTYFDRKDTAREDIMKKNVTAQIMVWEAEDITDILKCKRNQLYFIV